MIELNVAVQPLQYQSRSEPIFPLYMGQQACPPRHRYGRLRSHYLVHYVAGGTGTLYTGDAIHTLGPGQAFLLVPEQDHWYQADVHNPWEYWWLGFAAPPVATLQQWLGVTELSSVLLVQDRARFRAAYRDLWSLLRVFDRPTPPLALMEKLIVVLRSLIAGKRVSPHDAHSDAASTADLRWQRVCAFVEAHYCEPMTIDAICRATGTSRAELHRTVAQATGSAPMRYVTDLRMRRAADLLQEPNRPIGRIAHLVGYREYQTFVREFKRYYRVSPREFRRISSPDLRKR